MSEYADYPGGENFEPWQDHGWPEHCGVPATYLGEIGERELATLAAGGDVEAVSSGLRGSRRGPADYARRGAATRAGRKRNVGKHDPPLPLHELQLGHVPLGRQLGPAVK